MHASSSGAELPELRFFRLFIGFGESGRESGGESGGSPEGVRGESGGSPEGVRRESG